MNVFCWNCRGAGSGNFIREMREYIRLYNPAIIVLMEPRISGVTADAVCKKLGRSRCIRSDADGFSGGVWYLWSDQEVTIDLRYAHTNFLHFAVSSSRGRRWEFTAVYAPPNARKREGMWRSLDELRVEAHGRSLETSTVCCAKKKDHQVGERLQVSNRGQIERV